MDVTCCAYALATQDVCESHDTCYEDKVEAYNAVKAIVQAEEKVKKVEWRVYSRIECLLPVLGTDEAAKIEECRAQTHSTTHLDIEYPAIPEKSACQVEQGYPGTEAYQNANYASLPDNAKGKAVAVCAGMTGSMSVAAHSTASGPVIKVSSAGYTVGNYVHFFVKGEEVALNINSLGHKRGLHFATLNADLSTKSTGAFDTYHVQDDVTAMVNYVQAIPAGTLVLVGCWDECSNLMTADAYAALRSVGGTDQTLSFRQSFALVGVKNGEGIEKHSTTGPVDVEVSANKVQELLRPAYSETVGDCRYAGGGHDNYGTGNGDLASCKAQCNADPRCDAFDASASVATSSSTCWWLQNKGGKSPTGNGNAGSLCVIKQ